MVTLKTPMTLTMPLHPRFSRVHGLRLALASLCTLALSCSLAAQQAAPLSPSVRTEQAAPVAAPEDSATSTFSEDQLKTLLLSKPLYLRACYLDDALSFNEHGIIAGHPTPGSYTLCGVEIEKIHLSKHKVELLGARYGLHFLGALASEDPSTTIDRVRITPRKKFLRISIDREIVVKPKKIKKTHPSKKTSKNPDKIDALKPVSGAAHRSADSQAKSANLDSQSEDQNPKEEAPSEAEQLHASITAAPEAEKPADPNSVTSTTSPAHAAQLLRNALDRIFAPNLDERMKASMPDFWQLYYQAAAAKTDYRPSNPTVLRQNAVDRKARLITNFEPASNEFAQAAAVAGMALYHTVIGPDGKPSEIAVARPIGFGLDENAVASIRNAHFEPALKNGQPVSVLIDLVVQFRIFSQRTGLKNEPPVADKPTKPVPVPTQTPLLPGPYSRPQ